MEVMSEHLLTGAEHSGTVPQVVGPGVRRHAVDQGSTHVFCKGPESRCVWPCRLCSSNPSVIGRVCPQFG